MMNAYFYRSSDPIKSIFGCRIKEEGNIEVESDITDGADEIASQEDFNNLVARYVKVGDYIIILFNNTYTIFECIN